MSNPVASTSTQPPPPTELSLTGVAVEFRGKRPDKKFKLTIKLDGKERAVEIEKGGSVQLTGNIRCLEGAKITIRVHCRSRLPCWKEFATVQASLAANVPTLLDKKGRINITMAVNAYRNEDRQLSDAVAGLDAAKAVVEKKTVVADKLGKIMDVLTFVDNIGESLKDIHPAVGIAMTAVSTLVKLCEDQKACRDEAADLVEQLMAFTSIKGYEEKLKKREETRRAVHVMLVLISDASDYICQKTRTGLGGLIGDLIGSEYKEEIAKLQKQFGRAKESFDRSVQLEIFAAVDGIALDTQLSILDANLLPCKDAHFRPGEGCLAGTRADLRQRASNWIDDDDAVEPSVFWLFGNAGSGKSTVANTVAKMVDPDRGFQLSCFCCKRDDPNLSNPRRLLPTLAYRFAQQHESYRALVLDLIRDGVRGAGLATTADIATQFDKLFRKPLAQTLEPPRPHVTVFDALDECGSPEEQADLVKCLLTLPRIAPWIKVFVTSRNETAIRNVLYAPITDCMARDIKDEVGVDEDIQRYIKAQAKIPLSDEDVRRLVDLAQGLFIWCRTLFEYLGPVPLQRARLDKVLFGEMHQDLSQPWRKLYALYDTVLTSVVDDPEDNPEEVSFMREILLIIHIAARNRPLSVKAVMTFYLRGHGPSAKFDVEYAEYVVDKLHAILYKDPAANDAVRAHHASVYDYLEGKARTSTTSGWPSADAVHQLMAQSCLKTLHEDLKFNICEIEIPVLNKDVSDLSTRISGHISEVLQYSSRYWFTHVSTSTLAVSDVPQTILELLRTQKLLFWFECISLLGSLDWIRFTFRKIMRPFTTEYPAITAAVEDACRFANSFADAMDSIAHIYLSALWWLPENSLVYRNLGLAKSTRWRLIENKPKNWDALVWRSDQIGIRSVAFSPDGRFVACGAADGVVYIRDSRTGTLEGEPLRGHQKEVYSVAYSPDGCFIASGSSDNTVRIWDAKSGETTLGPLDGHSRTVSCIAYSPDGLFIASGSWDGTVRTWNARTGEPTGELLQHPDWVRGVAFSPDGRFIVSACNDRCVHVWDMSSRKEAAGPFQGHQDWVRSVAFSPDRCTIVSGSDDNMIRVWNAQTGEAIGEPLRGHTDYVNSVTYSPDGCFILSCSDDGTMRLWDAASHTPIGEPLQTHSGSVWCVSYSPDGSLIASASHDRVHVWDASTSFVGGNQSPDLSRQADTGAIYAVAYSPDGHFIASGSGGSDRIRIWDAQTGAAVDALVLRHAGMTQEGDVQSIAYSRDGQFIVSGSDDKDNSSVCVLDAETGATISGPLRGHSKTIWSVAYSPDSSRVASASVDDTVRLWDVQTGAAVGEALQVGSSANSVAFSLDGHLLACGTDDRSIWIWDAHTRASIRDPIQAHSNWVRSVAFSPDGRYIASGSHDRSVRIWDAQTGEAFGGPLRGHQDYVRCVAYSPDGRFIASGSADKTVIVWDAQSGLACGEPLRGHSGWINSVAYSLDGRFLASGADDGKIYVRHVPNDRDDVEARWLNSCSRLDPQDGWIKDDETLLLWVPVPYRDNMQSRARIVIPALTPNITSSSIDYRTLFRYSGTNWIDIISCFDK